MSAAHRIIVAGGGAGGLELATKLGRKLGKRGHAEVILIDAKRTHIWKPLLHEVAAGTLDSHENELEYLAQAHWNHFRFRLGYVDDVDLATRRVSVAPTRRTEQVMTSWPSPRRPSASRWMKVWLTLGYSPVR